MNGSELSDAQWEHLAPLLPQKPCTGRPAKNHRTVLEAAIPTKADQEPLPTFDRAAYLERNLVERLINRLKPKRRVATRYEKRGANYRAMVMIAALLWL